MAGTEGDGLLTILAGVAGVIRFTISQWIVSAVGAVIAAAVAVNAWVNLSDWAGDVDSDVLRASVGYGVYLVLIGAAAVALGSWESRRR